MFNKRFTLIITIIAAIVLMSGCSTENAEHSDEPQNAAAQGSSQDTSGSVHSTVFSNGGVQIDHPDEGYMEYIPPQNTSSDDSESEDLLGYDTVVVTAEQLADIAANTSYGDILEKLGKTQAFGQPYYRQYVTDDDRIIQLHFESKDDLCPYSGEELYERAMPIIYDGKVPGGMFYGLLAGDGGFVTYATGSDNKGITGGYLGARDAEIVFEDGTPASEDDLKPETAVFVQSDYTLEIYPGRMHCTKIVILK